MKPEQKPNVMKILNEYAGSHRHLITLGRILAAVTAFMGLVPFYDLWRIIRIAVNGENLHQIKGIAWEAVAVTIGALLLYIAALLCTHTAAFRVQANLRKSLMRRIITLPLGVFDEDGTGKIRRIVNESTAATETFIAHNLPDKAVAAATPVGLLILLAVFDWRMGLICLIPALIGFGVMMSMMGKGMQEKMAEYQNALDTMSSEATEYVRGIPVVKVFGQSVHSFRRFKSAIDGFGKWATEYTLLLRKPMVLFMTCINAVFAFLVLGAYILTKGGVTPDMILNVMYYIIVTPLLTVTLTKIAYSGEQEMVVVDALGRIDNILSIEPLQPSGGTAHPQDNSVTLEHVSYRYKDAAEFAVRDLNLEIPGGAHIALVGPSGGGKTTVSRLAARFWDVTGGMITLGGMDISKVDPETLFSAFSIVFQDVTLFNQSVMDNIRIGKKDATDEEVMAAAKLANCDAFVSRLPDGYNTLIGENGSELSGGERQRISIARAFLKDAPIILLDEASASLDVENETAIQTALSRLIRNKTVMVIAHRMRTVSGADKIVVLADGVVQESGKPSELMQKGGIFANMVRTQNESQNWVIG